MADQKKYKELQDIIAILGMDEISELDEIQVSRARQTIRLAESLLREKEAAIGTGRVIGITANEILEKMASEDPPYPEPTLY